MTIDPFIDTWTEMSLYVIITANESVFGLTNHKDKTEKRKQNQNAISKGIGPWGRPLILILRQPGNERMIPPGA